MRGVVLGLLLALAGAGRALAEQPVSTPVVIEVNGAAIVSVAPDAATVPVTVASTDETSAAATSRAERDAARLVAFMKTLGAAEKDIQVQPVRAMPRGPQTYPLVRSEKPGDVTAPGSTAKAGFEATSRIEVRFTNLDKAAQFVAQARDNGASAVHSIRYSVADPTDGADKARQAAFDAARRKAERLAAMAGLKLGRLIRITIPSRDLLAVFSGTSRATDGPQSDDVVRIGAEVQEGVKSVEVRASLDVAWNAE